MEAVDSTVRDFISDLNWVNSTLHDFSARVAFMEVTEMSLNNYKELQELKPTLIRVYNATANDAVLKITNIYEKDSQVISLYNLKKWLITNAHLVKRAAPSISKDFKNDLELLDKRILEFKPLLKKFLDTRNTIVAHGNKQVVSRLDIRRNLTMWRSGNNNAEQFGDTAQKYFDNAKPLLLETKNFVDIRDFTIDIILELKKVLCMPDKMFVQSGSLDEWKSFLAYQKETFQYLYEVILRGARN